MPVGVWVHNARRLAGPCCSSRLPGEQVQAGRCRCTGSQAAAWLGGCHQRASRASGGRQEQANTWTAACKPVTAAEDGEACKAWHKCMLSACRGFELGQVGVCVCECVSVSVSVSVSVCVCVCVCACARAPHSCMLRSRPHAPALQMLVPGDGCCWTPGMLHLSLPGPA